MKYRVVASNTETNYRETIHMSSASFACDVAGILMLAAWRANRIGVRQGNDLLLSFSANDPVGTETRSWNVVDNRDWNC